MTKDIIPPPPQDYVYPVERLETVVSDLVKRLLPVLKDKQTEENLIYLITQQLKNSLGHQMVYLRPLTKAEYLEKISIDPDSSDHLTRVIAPMARQVGGDHYKIQKIQHYDYCMANNLPWGESSAIKYLSRHMHKGKSREDLLKALHYTEMTLEHYHPGALAEWRAGSKPASA